MPRQPTHQQRLGKGNHNTYILREQHLPTFTLNQTECTKTMVRALTAQWNPLANIFNQLATEAYNMETRIHINMHSMFSTQQLPHKTFSMQLTTLAFSESPSIPFITITGREFCCSGLPPGSSPLLGATCSTPASNLPPI
jgi:hypothetical protein